MIDYILRNVEGLGFLPIVIVDDIEVYRGEYAPDPTTALNKAMKFMLEAGNGSN